MPDPPLELPSELPEEKRRSLEAEVARLKEEKQKAVEEEEKLVLLAFWFWKFWGISDWMMMQCFFWVSFDFVL